MMKMRTAMHHGTWICRISVVSVVHGQLYTAFAVRYGYEVRHSGSEQHYMLTSQIVNW